MDTDTDNPDVFKAHKELGLPNLLCRLNSLDDADGWADLLDTVQNYPDHAVIINAAARTKTSTASYGDIMKEALREMRRELVVFWIINRHRTGISARLYEALPEKVSGTSRGIMGSMAAAAEKETAIQARLTNSVVKEARSLTSKVQ